MLWSTKYLGEEAVTVTEAQANISDQDVEQATLQSVILLFQICNRSQLMEQLSFYFKFVIVVS